VCGVILALGDERLLLPVLSLRVTTSFPLSGVHVPGLLILKDLPLIVPQDHLSFVLGNQVGRSYRDLAPPPGASITKLGTAYPVVWPRSFSMMLIPTAMGVRKCSVPMARSH